MEYIAIVELTATIVEYALKARRRWKDLHRMPKEIEEALEQIDRLQKFSTVLEKSCSHDGLPIGLWPRSTLKEILDKAISLQTEVKERMTDFQREIAVAKNRVRKFMTLTKLYRRDDSPRNLDTKLAHMMEQVETELRIWNLSTQQFQRRLQAMAVLEEIGSIVPHAQTGFSHSIQPTKTKALQRTSKWVPLTETTSFMLPWFLQQLSLRTYMRTYYVVPRSGPTFGAVERGDVCELRRLFESGQASPLDRDEDGYTLLHIATEKQQVNVCRMLVDLVPSETIDDRDNLHYQSPLDLSLDLWFCRRGGPPTEGEEDIQQLFRARYKLDPERLFDFVMEVDYSDETVHRVHKTYLRDYYALSMGERFGYFRMGSFLTRRTSILERLLYPKRGYGNQFREMDIRDSIRTGISIVHSCAIAFGKRYSDHVLRGEVEILNPYATWNWQWARLVEDVVAESLPTYLHTIETVEPPEEYGAPAWIGTPLISVLGGVLCRISINVDRDSWNAIFHKVLAKWLECLVHAGVDLSQYGLREIEAWRRDARCGFGSEVKRTGFSRHSPASKDLRIVHRGSELEDVLGKDGMLPHWIPLRLKGLTYGPALSDWRLDWELDEKSTASEVPVAKTASRMPGGWVE